MDPKNMESILKRLKGYFDPHLRTRLSDWRPLASYMVIEQIKNRAIVKQPGEKEKFLRFILEGAAALLEEQDSRELCFDLCFEDEFLADFESLSADKPTKVYIRTFEPVFAVVIDRPRLYRIFRSSPLGCRLGNILTENRHRRDLTNHRGFHATTTVEERYLKLLHSHPHILLRTPQRYLASYLGASVQNLSRVRKKIAGK